MSDAPFRSVYSPGTAAIVARFPVVEADLADDAVTTAKLADAAVTQDKVTPDVADGLTITGSVLRTAASGERIVIRNDGSGGIIESFSGLASETPGALDPAMYLGTFPSMVLRSGTTATYNRKAAVGLYSSNSTSTIECVADILQLYDQSGTPTWQVVAGIGIGVGFDSFQVVCSASASPNSTTNVTITGFSQAVTSPGTNAVYLVTIDADWAITVAGTIAIIELLVDGTPQTAQMVLSDSGTNRVPATKTWRITGLSAASHTFTARTRNTAGSTGSTVSVTHSLMTVERKA